MSHECEYGCHLLTGQVIDHMCLACIQKMPEVSVSECLCCKAHIPEEDRGIGYICTECGWEADSLEECEFGGYSSANHTTIELWRAAFRVHGNKVGELERRGEINLRPWDDVS